MSSPGDDFSEFGGRRMHEPPIFEAKIETIDDAELARWMTLAVRCRCGEVHYPWRLLRQRTRYRRLSEIAERLRCKRRGCRPDRVWLYWRGGADAQEIYERDILTALSDK
jgi:hypothetical protein